MEENLTVANKEEQTETGCYLFLENQDLLIDATVVNPDDLNEGFSLIRGFIDGLNEEDAYAAKLVTSEAIHGVVSSITFLHLKEEDQKAYMDAFQAVLKIFDEIFDREKAERDKENNEE